MPTDEGNMAENRRLDGLWKKLTARKTEVVPILRGELEQEAKKPVPDQFFLLDAAHFLQLNDSDSRELVFSALEKIDPAQPAIKANATELFNLVFAYADGSEGNEKVLPLIDRLFLVTDFKVIVPEHSLTLRGSILCAFLYGPFGEKAERHLASLIDQSPKHSEQIVGMLNWMGSPASVDAVKRVIDQKPNGQVFSMAIGFFMRVGGAAGREAALHIDPALLDDESRKYYQQSRPGIEKMSYDYILDSLKKAGEKTESPSQDVLEKQLTTMYETGGKDGRPNPVALLTAKMPKEQLVDRLLKIRGRMFRRLSDEAIDDIEGINGFIEALLLRKN